MFASKQESILQYLYSIILDLNTLNRVPLITGIMIYIPLF